MVKRELKTSVSESNGESGILNENRKRVSDTQNTDAPKRVKTKSLYRQPTVQELNRLQETENLFNSNLFRLQIDEILQEVKLKEKTEKKFNDWFALLKNYLLSVPKDDTEYDLTEQTLPKKLNVKLPIPKELNKTNCMFKFQNFKNIELTGSYTLGCVINSKLIVNVQITAPAETYTKNDSVNYRYHRKRAAFLAYIASHLSSTELIEKLEYTNLNSCTTKPVLDLKPAGKLGNHLTVRIDVTCEEEAYKLHRFSPSRNNLRESWLFDNGNENVTELGPPTPYYNSSVLSDLTAKANQEFLNNILLKSDNLKQAIVLLKIWLRQRDLKVSGHIVSLFVAYFVQNKRINNIMSSYQIVRNIWIALKSLELDKNGISLHKGDDSPPLEDFHQNFPVVFLDVTGHYNICWSMCKGTYQAMKREAGLAVEMLDNSKINSFLSLFMTPLKPLLQFDHILKFKDLKALKTSIISKALKQSRLNYGLDTLALTTDTLHALFVKGLGKRAELVLQIVEDDLSWPIRKKLEKAVGDRCVEKLSFGFVLNPEHATTTVERGPPANLPEAEQFRLFWGSKSELRRFQDGSITETVVWRGHSAAQCRTVTTQILNYLMRTKYDTPPTALYHVSHQFEPLLLGPQCPDGSASLDVEELSSRVVTTFDELRRDLRGLADLPLDVSACNGVSSVFSYSSPAPPRAGPRAGGWRRGGAGLVPDSPRPRRLPRYVPVARAVLELGHSGKWPGEINAFRSLKAAFHLQIAQQLTKQYSIATQAYPNHVDVMKNGLVFRVSIAHPKEMTLLRKEIENGVAKYRDTEESLKLYRDCVVMPRIRGALHGLHQKHPSFGPTAALFKRWLSCQLLAPPHLPPPLPEALVARLFLPGAPVPPPRAPTLGLLRVWQMLVATDWDNEVVVLDFNDDLTAEQISSIQRSVSPRPALCVVAAPERAPLPAPAPRLRARLVALAAAALAHAQRELDRCGDNFLAAFVPSLSGYDVLIHLDPSLVAPWQGSHPQGATETDDEVIPVVDFNVVTKYLDELRSAYDDFALFFNDRYGGDVIAVLWKPDINEFKEFQSLTAHALAPVQDGSTIKYKVNIPAIIEDFKTMGAGLVKNVTVQSL